MASIQRKDAQRLDETDRRILRAMQQNARLTTAELADRVGLSTTPCWNRLKRLEKQGYIDGYVALLNQEKLGLPETVIIEVTLDRHDEETLTRFGEMLASQFRLPRGSQGRAYRRCSLEGRLVHREAATRLARGGTGLCRLGLLAGVLSPEAGY